MPKENIYNIPNVLSAYRLLIFPFILYLVVRDNEILFSFFIGINLLTDFLDGWIARTLNQVTKFGARLDSLADYGTFLLAFLGLLKFKSTDLYVHGWILYLFIGLLIVSQIIHIIKFGSFSSMHIYSFKLTGYLHGILFISWFSVGLLPWFYYLAMTVGVFAEIELIIITFCISEKRSNAKGLYWVLRN